MFRRLLQKISIPSIKRPKIELPTISFRLPKISLPIIRVSLPKIDFPTKKIATILGAVNTTLLVLIGSLGLFVSYINPIPSITPYISLAVANVLLAGYHLVHICVESRVDGSNSHAL